MTTEQIRAAFVDGLVRAQAARPSRAYKLYIDSVHAEREAGEVWAWWWWGARRVAPDEEAAVFQAVDVLMRFSGLAAIDSARMALSGATDLDI